MANARVREILTTATDPLAILVEIAANNEADLQLRAQCATAACPYLYPRLSAAVVTTVPSPDANHSARLVDQVLARIAKIAPPLPTIEHVAAPIGAD